MGSNAMSSTAQQLPGAPTAVALRAKADFIRELNLNPIRTRAQELARSLDDVIAALHSRPDKIVWAEALDKFALINLQYYQLSQQLVLQLRHRVAFPKAVNEGNAPVLPVLLATKLLPEMEAQEAALRERHMAAVGHLGLGDQIARIEMQASHLNGVIQSLTTHNPQQPNSGVLDPKGPHRRMLNQQRHAALGPSASRPSWQQERIWLPQAGALPSRASDGADIVLAAALRGEGLR